jgi:hypothetical protein
LLCPARLVGPLQVFRTIVREPQLCDASPCGLEPSAAGRALAQCPNKAVPTGERGRRWTSSV